MAELSSSDRTFTISSFNTRWGLTIDDEPFDLPAVVSSFDTDVVALQEVWDPADDPGRLHSLASTLGYQVVAAPLAASFIDPQPEITTDLQRASGTWGIAFLSRLPVVDVEIIDLGRLVDRWDVATRYAVLADVQVGSATVTIATVHLSFALPNALAQLRRLNAVLPRNRLSVVVGDCNLWGPAAATALGGRRRAVRGRTWPAHRPHSQLDHILLSPGLRSEQGQVLPAAGSDHLPVKARLSITDR
ncbi:MAG: endonuclease/exonuclease/phosphatase family protein [Aquihabitans sp.]